MGITVKDFDAFNDEENEGLYNYHKEEIARVRGFEFGFRVKNGEIVLTEALMDAVGEALDSKAESGGEISIQVENRQDPVLVLYRLKNGWRDDPLTNLPTEERLAIAKNYWQD